MREAPSQPACPGCGYDQSGAVATWTHACPLTITCTECGGVFPCSNIFARVEIGPAWSFEHARRRILRRWIATTVKVFEPSRLWREVRPEHPVRRGRLAILAAMWLAVLHLACGGMVLASQGFMAAAGSWSVFDSWNPREVRSWMMVGRVLAWPYGHHVELPLDNGTSYANPMYGFVLAAALPVVMLAMALWIWSWRWKLEGGGHLARAGVLWMPHLTLWTFLSTVAFAAIGQFETPTSTSDWTMVAFLGSAAAYAASIIWWWR